MFRLKIAIVVIGGVLTFFGFQELRLRSVVKSDPQTITCADLGEHGPGDNANVIMSDFLLCDFSYVYEQREHSRNWEKVWVPAVPLEGEYHQMILSRLKPDGSIDGEIPPPKDVKVIVQSSQVMNEGALTKLAADETLPGLIINEIASLGSEEQKLLRESYPGVDFNKVYILEHMRKPQHAGLSAAMVGGGVLLAGVGVLSFFLGRKR
jgi:hypothetical protein